MAAREPERADLADRHASIERPRWSHGLLGACDVWGGECEYEGDDREDADFIRRAHEVARSLLRCNGGPSNLLTEIRAR